MRHLINEPGRNHSCITLVRHSSNESSNNTHVQCWITRAKIRKKPNLSLFYFFSVRHFRNEHESTMLVSNFVSPWWYISVTKMLILKISHQVPSKRDSSRHLVAWIWQPCIAPARLTMVKCFSYQKRLTNVSPNQWIWWSRKWTFLAFPDKKRDISSKIWTPVW